MDSTFKSLMKNQSELGDEVVPPSPLRDWSAYLAIGPVASEDFIDGIQKLPVRDRKL